MAAKEFLVIKLGLLSLMPAEGAIIDSDCDAPAGKTCCQVAFETQVAPLLKPEVIATKPYSCVLEIPPCSSSRQSTNKCSKPGDEWIR